MCSVDVRPCENAGKLTSAGLAGKAPLSAPALLRSLCSHLLSALYRSTRPAHLWRAVHVWSWLVSMAAACFTRGLWLALAGNCKSGRAGPVRNDAAAASHGPPIQVVTLHCGVYSAQPPEAESPVAASAAPCNRWKTLATWCGRPQRQPVCSSSITANCLVSGL